MAAHDETMRPLVAFGGAADGATRGRVSARVARDDVTISLAFDLAAPPGTVRVPARAAVPARRDELWRGTCFEAFLAPVCGAAYWEVNVAPSGDWNVYRFDGYRAGMTPEPRLTEVRTERDEREGATLALRAALDVAAVPELASGALEVGLAAVLEERDGRLAYHALVHPGERPDFHRRDGFAVRLA